MHDSESGNRLSSARVGSHETKTRSKRKPVTNKTKTRLRPLHVCMAIILLVIGVLPFANLITVRQFVHDHPILSFVDFEESNFESEEGNEKDPSDWAPAQPQVVLSPPFDKPSSSSSSNIESENHTEKKKIKETNKKKVSDDEKITPKTTVSSSSSKSHSLPLHQKDSPETEGIFGSFLESFGIAKNKDNDQLNKNKDRIDNEKNKKKQRDINDIKPSKEPCQDVFLFIAVREDSYHSRQLYRNSWLNPKKWLPIKGGKTNPMAEELPSIAYRFFIIENESEDEYYEIDNNFPHISDTERKMKRKELVKHDDIVIVPLEKTTSTSKKNTALSTSTMSPTVVRNWIMSWVLKQTEFRFMLFLDLGKSSPIITLPSPPSSSLQISKTGKMSRKELQRIKDNLNNNNEDIKKEGNGYSMVCVERIADELRYRPNERFYWGTQTCGGETSSSQSSSLNHEDSNYVGYPNHRPKFQLYSQDVVELLTLAQSKLQSHDDEVNKKLGMSSDALLAALKLTLLDDRLRIQDVSSSSSLLLHAKTAVHSAKSEWYKSQHSAGMINTSTFKLLQQELTAWSKNVDEDEEVNKGDAPDKAKLQPQRKKKNNGPEPVCKMMTMMTGLTDEEDLHALEASNTNRTKPWKQYRDQIMRLGPPCDSALTFEDVGLTTAKAFTASPTAPQSTSHSESSGQDSIKAKTSLAYSFLDNDELFDDEERFSILQKCSIHGDCLWREITTTAVERWWHMVDNQRAGRCYRSDAHSKGATCDAFKSRKFLSDALVENQQASLKPRPSSSTSTFENAAALSSSSAPPAGSAKKGSMIKRKQEAGQKAVDKKHASGAVLASFPGSGNTWSRMLLEYASGYYTGSIYNDITLMPVLPAEGVRTHEVLAWKAHTFPSQYIDNYKPAKVVLLVRHPISALWSEFQRRLNVEAGSRGGGGHVAAIKSLSNAEKSNFKTWSTCMACRWIQYITAHLQLAQVIPLKILLFERLAVDTVNAMREVLEFLGVANIDEDRLLCATRLADHPLVHRPPANFTMHDAFKSFPDQACTILRTIEQTDQGRLIMRLLGYGNSIKPPKECAVQKDDVFACGDMLTEEFHGSKQCKLGSSSSASSAPPQQQQRVTTITRGGVTSSTASPQSKSSKSNGIGFKAATNSNKATGTKSDVSKQQAAAAARAKYEASKSRHK